MDLLPREHTQFHTIATSTTLIFGRWRKTQSEVVGNEVHFDSISLRGLSEQSPSDGRIAWSIFFWKKAVGGINPYSVTMRCSVWGRCWRIAQLPNCLPRIGQSTQYFLARLQCVKVHTYQRTIGWWDLVRPCLLVPWPRFQKCQFSGLMFIYEGILDAHFLILSRLSSNWAT